MNNVYFNDLFSVVQNNLLSAKKYIKIAVCWINFQMFLPTFERILKSGVRIDIIISNHKANYLQEKIQYLEELQKSYNVSITLLKMPSLSLMHHKFCIIDGYKLLTGSYNWTKAATINNFENLLLIEDKHIVEKFEFEFLELQAYPQCLYSSLIKQQRNGTIYVATVEQEGEYHSRVSIYKIEDYNVECMEEYTEYFDISLSITMSSIGDDLYDEYEYNSEYVEQENIKQEFEFHKFMINHFSSLPGLPPIHAFGTISHNMQLDGSDEVSLDIIWKNRFVAYYIEDSYPLYIA